MTRIRLIAAGVALGLASAGFAAGEAEAGTTKRRATAAAKAPATETAGGTAKVFASVLNVRSGPGTGYADIGNLYKGQVVRLLGRTKQAFKVPGYSGAFRWYRVNMGKLTGWSWGGYLQIGGKTPPARNPGGGQPKPAPAKVGGKPVESFNDVGAVFASSLNVRAEPSVAARVVARLAYGKVARLTARTKFQYAVAGYRGSFRWYRVQVGGVTGWAWGGFISVGKRTPPQRNPGGGQQCDSRRANCNPHTPVGGGPAHNPPGTSKPVPSSGAALSVFPVAGKHWSWNRKACGYNDYYHGQGVNHPNGHIGNDIFAARGTPLVAAVSGTVVRAGYGGSVGGNRVTIKRGNWYFYYAHMHTVSVRAGQTVKAGQKVGTLGNTGSASGTEPHLHFSIYPNDNYNAGVNPYPYAVKVDPQCK